MFDHGCSQPTQQFATLRCTNAPALPVRSAAHACLLEVFGDDVGRLGLQTAGKVIAGLRGLAPTRLHRPVQGVPRELGGASARTASPATLGCCHLAPWTPSLTSRRIPDGEDDLRPRQRRRGALAQVRDLSARLTLAHPDALY
jgi:hypothetical protein